MTGGGGVTRTEELGAWRCREVITDDPGWGGGGGGSGHTNRGVGVWCGWREVISSDQGEGSHTN